MLKRIVNKFKNSDSLLLKQSESGIWMVKRRFNVVYMGSKEKCEMYLSHLKAA